MAVTISKVDVWAGTVSDRPGGLGQVLDKLTQAGADFEFVIARRAAEEQGSSVVFLAPLKGTKQTKAAKDAGFAKAESLYSLRMEGPDKPGLGAKITMALGDAGINMRGLSAAGIAKRMVVYFAFDSETDAKNAAKALKKAFGQK